MAEPDLPPPPPPLPPLKKQDMTLIQLKQYDGTGEEGRVCVAVNGKVYDVTKGKRFYGPGKQDGLLKIANCETACMLRLA